MVSNNPGRSGASIATSITEERLMFSSTTITRGGLASEQELLGSFGDIASVIVDVCPRSFSSGSDGTNPLSKKS